MPAQQKTIFVVITKGFIVRNILRSGVLEHLKKSGAHIVIFLNNMREWELPQAFREEFEDAQVTVEVVPNPPRKFAQRSFGRFTRLLLYNWRNLHIAYAQKGVSSVRVFFERIIFTFLSKFDFLKKLSRVIKEKVYYNSAYASYFDAYRPDLVFSTSIISNVDMTFLAEAKRRGIKTVAMPKVWDNITTHFYFSVPDKLIVQNEIMKEGATRYQAVKPEIIKVRGFPQFDWYRRPEILMTREEFFKKLGLDPGRRLIFWGAAGTDTPKDVNIAHVLIKAINTPGVLAKPCNLFVRSHPFDAKHGRHNYLEKEPHVAVDRNFTFCNFFHDNVEPSVEEIKHFINIIYHMDMLVALCSTLTLDAFCFDKPVVNPMFQGFYDHKGRDITPIFYSHDHYDQVFEENAVDFVYSEKELIEKVNNALLHPEEKTKERKRALERLCYKVDGGSAKRVADEVLEML